MDTLRNFSYLINGTFDFSMEVFNQLIPFLIAGAIIILSLFIKEMVYKIREAGRKPKSIYLTGSIDRENQKRVDIRLVDITDTITGKREKPRQTSSSSTARPAIKKQDRVYPHLVQTTGAPSSNRMKKPGSRLITLTLAENTHKIDADMSREEYDSNGYGLMNDLKELVAQNGKNMVRVSDVRLHLRNEIQRAKDIVNRHAELKAIREKESKRLFGPIKDALKEMQNDLVELNGDIRIRCSDEDVSIELGNNSNLMIYRYGNSNYFQLLERHEFELPEPYFYEAEKEFQNHDMVIDYISKVIARHIALKEYGAFHIFNTAANNPA